MGMADRYANPLAASGVFDDTPMQEIFGSTDSAGLMNWNPGAGFYGFNQDYEALADFDAQRASNWYNQYQQGGNLIDPNASFGGYGNWSNWSQNAWSNMNQGGSGYNPFSGSGQYGGGG